MNRHLFEWQPRAVVALLTANCAVTSPWGVSRHSSAHFFALKKLPYGAELVLLPDETLDFI